MPRGDTWDTPGGPGGEEVLEEIGRLAGASRAGGARSLYRKWREAVDDLDPDAYKVTVNRAEFNTFRRARLDTGITDEQLAESFKNFATAVTYGPISVRHGDLWRSYAASWARWVPAVVREPLRDRTERSDWQR